MSRTRSPVFQRCSDHEGKPFEFYCRSCEDLACPVCVLEEHRDHTEQVGDAKDVLPHHMTKIKDLYEQANVHLEEAQDLLDDMAGAIGKLKENKECAEKRIRNYFQRMKNILIDREHNFINIVRRNAEEKKKSSNAVRKSASELVQGLIGCVKGLGDLSNRTNDIMVLREEKRMVAELESVVKLLKELQDSSVIDTRVTLPCIEDQNFEKVCRLVGDPFFTVCPPDCRGKERQQIAASSPCLVPPIPPRLSNKDKRAQTDPVDAAVPTARPLNHPRSKSSIDPVQILTSPPPIPPKSPNKSQNDLPQWLIDYKKQMDEENKKPKFPNDYESLPQSSPNQPRKLQRPNDYEPLSQSPPNQPRKPPRPSDYEPLPQSPPNQLKKPNDYEPLPQSPPSQLRKPPKPKPRKDIANKTSNGVSNLDPKPSSPNESVAANGIPTDLKLGDFHINIDPPTPVNEIEDNSTLRVYEISLKQMISPGSMMKTGVFPSDLCVGPSNTLIVCDTKNSCIRMLTNTGKFLDYIGQDDGNESHFSEPVAVCVDKTGSIMVLDASPPRIFKFSNTGKYVSKLAPRGLRSSQMVKPQGMAISHNGNILVSDWSKSCVHIFDSSGRYIKNFGSGNTSSGVFMMQPTGIAVDANGRVIICDGMAHSVWIYTPSGELLNHFGWQGANAGDLHTPHGVTIDSRGQLYITEQGNSRVSVFKESGDFLKCFGCRGSLIAKFDNPQGLCVDGDNRLIVADEGNQRLQIFDIS